MIFLDVGSLEVEAASAGGSTAISILSLRKRPHLWTTARVEGMGIEAKNVPRDSRGIPGSPGVCGFFEEEAVSH